MSDTFTAGVVGVLLVITAVALRSAVVATGRRRVAGRLPAPGGIVTANASRASHALPAPGWFARALTDGEIHVEPGLAWTAWVVTGTAAALVGLLVASLSGLVVAAGVAAGGPGLGLWLRRGRAAASLERGLPGALEELARALRAGTSLRLAIAGAAATTPGRLGDALAEVARRAEHGVPLPAALDGWVATTDAPGVRLAAAALTLGLEAGGAHARAVDGVAATLRDNVQLSAELRAQSAQARASAVLITLAPLGFTGMAAVLQPSTGNFLLRTTPGLACLAAGLTLDALGAVWMARITRAAS